MSVIELYERQVKPLTSEERLQLARWILDDLEVAPPPPANVMNQGRAAESSDARSGSPARASIATLPAGAPLESPEKRRYGAVFALLLLPLGFLTCITIFVSALLSGAVRTFKVEGTAMEPTLHGGQFIVTNNLAYSLSGEPQRGDIIVFETWTPGRDAIKRVVGVPGETVEIHDSAVWVNGERLDEPYLDQSATGSTEPILLGANEFFVLGDNRGNSSDSRNHGALEGDQIIGKAWFTYWPPEQVGFIAHGQP